MDNIKPDWNTLPTDFLLSERDIHIWRANLDLPIGEIEKLGQTLSVDERARAGRFHFEEDRRRFIARRGILRLILGHYMGVEPGAIRFCYDKSGKPRLQNAFGKTDIRFNLSHSAGLVFYVFTRDHEAGVDLERIRDFPEMDQIVEQFFSVKERGVFGAFQLTPAEKMCQY